ncbi:MAG: hypothetical protein DCC55_32715 [Chloroflexi bacterium]|nr:MAG: hypothetical protein DCC55_32715 [Chloroflexota bacterium]
MSEQARFSPSPQPTPEMQEEFTLLMSLRLDNLLDSSEQQQFDSYVERYPLLARQWQEWQRLHQQIAATPHAEPPPGFVDRVELCLVQFERRRRLWQGILFGGLVVLLWSGLVATIVGLGAFLLLSQGVQLNDLIYLLAYLSSTVGHWFAMLRDSLGAIAASPQTMVMLLLYVTLATILLSLWVRFLRRTTTGQGDNSVAASVA